MGLILFWIANYEHRTVDPEWAITVATGPALTFVRNDSRCSGQARCIERTESLKVFVQNAPMMANFSKPPQRHQLEDKQFAVRPTTQK